MTAFETETATKTTITQVKGSHLIVESLRDELVVFDRRTNKAHMLDARAAAIWNAAENGCSMDDVAALVEGKTTEQKRAAARLGIADMEQAGLLLSTLPAMPRRSLLKTLGTAAMLPAVVSILAPTPAAAQTSAALGSACTVGVTTCAAGTCTAGATGAPTTRCCHASGVSAAGSCLGNNTNNLATLTCCSGACGSGATKGQCA